MGHVKPVGKQRKPGNGESDLDGTREVWEGGGARWCMCTEEEGVGEIAEAAKLVNSEGQESDMVGVKVSDEEGSINM